MKDTAQKIFKQIGITDTKLQKWKTLQTNITLKYRVYPLRENYLCFL